MCVILRLGTRDNRKSMNLHLVPAVFVVWKWTKKKKKHSVSTGFKTERPAAASPEMSYDFEGHDCCGIWQTEGDLNTL